MQLKYNRQQSIGNSLFKLFLKFLLILIVLFVALFIIEKKNFPKPNNNFKIDITDEIKRLK